MKIKLLGDWFGLSFGAFLLVAAIVAIPAGGWIGGLLVGPGASLPQVQTVALAQNQPEAAIGPSGPTPPADVTPNAAAAHEAPVIPPAPSPTTSIEPAAPREVAAANPRPVAAPVPAQPAGIKTTEVPSKIPASRSESAPAPAPNTPGTWLQVAAMRQGENAQKLADKLKTKGYPVFIKGPGQNSLYLVQAGPYPDQQSAKTAAESLRSDGFDAIVMR